MALGFSSLLFAACTSGVSDSVVQEPAAAATPEVETTAPTETPTVAPTTEPATSPAVSDLSDDEMIAAAVAAFDSGPQTEALVSWDHLSATVNDDTVRLEVCAWDGLNVYDDLRLVEYIVTADGADFIFDSSLPDDCLNTQIVADVLATTQAYDDVWGSALSDPASFNIDAAGEVMTANHLDVNQPKVADWVANGASFRGSTFDGGLPDTNVRPLAWRRYQIDDLDIFELIACRDLSPAFGLYRDDVLIDDEKGPNAVGEHGIDNYQMVRSDGAWLVAGLDATRWSSCDAADWLVLLNNWKPEPVAWALVP